MNLLVRSAMIFFGTMMAAGLVALGEPPPAPRAGPEAASQHSPQPGDGRTASAEAPQDR